jgi:FkbM family methyltransferase
MMLPLKNILSKYNIYPNGVIHVGAHFAEEHYEYTECGIKKFVYIEPCLPAYDNMLSKFNGQENISIFNCACGKEDAFLPMYVSHQNEGQSNSILAPKLHKEQHPEIIFDDAEIVTVTPLSKIPFERSDFNFLVMDCQGYEGEVLKGADNVLPSIDIIYTEVNRGQTYEGNMEIDEMIKFLDERGFELKEVFWPSAHLTWGDAVFIRKLA